MALLQNSWMNQIEGVFTGKKETIDEPTNLSAESFTLLRYADELKNTSWLGSFNKFIVGRSSEATFADAFEKQEAIIRYLGGFDSTGENIQTSQKKEAARKCNCTIADVEHVLAKFTWAKEAHNKMEKLKEEGKPLPKNIAEVQKLVGSTPMDVARSNLAKSGQMSRNALCPCGSKKRYKRCCGKDKVNINKEDENSWAASYQHHQWRRRSCFFSRFRVFPLEKEKPSSFESYSLFCFVIKQLKCVRR